MAEFILHGQPDSSPEKPIVPLTLNTEEYQRKWVIDFLARR
jgi:hypothetical protein